MTSVSWLSAATTKLGTEMPRITRNMMTMSGKRLRYSAVSAPHKIPPRAANTMAEHAERRRHREMLANDVVDAPVLLRERNAEIAAQHVAQVNQSTVR